MPVVRGSPNPRHYRLPFRLRMARKQSGLTRMALAQKASVSNATVSHIETDQRLPSVGTVARLAAALGLSAAWLAFGLGETNAGASAVSCDGMGARLRTARIDKAQTKAALGRLADLAAPSISQIENGGQAGVDTIEKLAKALKISPAWLAYGVGPQELPPRRRPRPTAPSASLAPK